MGDGSQVWTGESFAGRVPRLPGAADILHRDGGLSQYAFHGDRRRRAGVCAGHDCFAQLFFAARRSGGARPRVSARRRPPGRAALGGRQLRPMAKAVWRRSESDRQIADDQRRERDRDRSYAAELSIEPEHGFMAQPEPDGAGLSDELPRRHAGDARESLPQSDGEAQTGRDSSTGASRFERSCGAPRATVSRPGRSRRARRLC